MPLGRCQELRLGATVVVLATAVCASLLAATSASRQAQQDVSADVPAVPARLTLEGAHDDMLTRTSGSERASRTVALIFTSSAPLQSAPSVVLSDPIKDGTSDVFDGTVTAAAELAGATTVQVGVSIDPA